MHCPLKSCFLLHFTTTIGGGTSERSVFTIFTFRFYNSGVTDLCIYKYGRDHSHRLSAYARFTQA